MEKVPNQKSVDIRPIPFHNNDPINNQLENTGDILVALQPKYPLHSVVYPISESKSSTTFKSLIRLKQNRWWVMNVMNNGKWIDDVATMKMRYN